MVSLQEAVAIMYSAYWAIKGFTIALGIVACWVAINKKNNPALITAIISTAVFVFLSPLISWIISISCIIWANNKPGLFQPTQANAAVSSQVQSSSEESEEEKPIRCRYCKKYYSSEFNGCPYCKKK